MSVVTDTSAVVQRATSSSSRRVGLLSRIRGMLFAPTAEWALIAAETTPTARLYTTFIAPLALLDALIGFILVTAGSVHVPFCGGVISARLVFVFGLLGIFLVAVIIDAVAPFIGAGSNRRLAAAIAAYASTPIWLATVFVPLPTVR